MLGFVELYSSKRINDEAHINYFYMEENMENIRNQCTVYEVFSSGTYDPVLPQSD